ncbi:hypothetical protein DsansV1_C10g0100911 [Dioscorea sansibarensis]
MSNGSIFISFGSIYTDCKPSYSKQNKLISCIGPSDVHWKSFFVGYRSLPKIFVRLCNLLSQR